MRTIKNRMSDRKLAAIIAGIFSGAVVLAIVAAIVVRLLLPSSKEPAYSSSSMPQNETISSSISKTESETSSDTVIYETDEGTSFDVPDELRAVYLKPGQDFLLKNTDSEETIKKQIDTALDSTVKLKFNSVVIFTKTTYGTIFDDSELKSINEQFDILKYALESAKSRKLYTYVVYPVFAEQKDSKVVGISDFTQSVAEKTVKRAEEFSKKYQPSAIIFDDYCISLTDSMKAFVEANANGRDTGDFLRANVTENIRLVRNVMRQNNKVSQIGLLADSVWANYTTNEKGSKTSASFESFVDGYADTRDFVLNQKFNFVMVENLMPTDSVNSNFKVIAQWWTTLCSQADIAFYNVHASSKLFVGPGEFTSPDQLIRQVSELKGLKTYLGSVFDSLSVLVSDKEGSTTLLLKYFDNQIKDTKDL